MKLSRLPVILLIITGLVLITVAIQIEKPAVQLCEMRPDRLGTHFRDIAFSPDKETAWAVGFAGMIVRSDDGGITWKKQKSGTRARLYGLHILTRNNLYCCGSEGTLLVTSNGGDHWRKIPVPTRLRLVDVFFLNPLTGWVVGDDGCVMRTEDGGKNWTQLDTGHTTGFRRIWFKNRHEGFAAGYEGVLLSTGNGGDSWTRLVIPDNISYYGAHFGSDEDTCVLVGSCGMMVISTDAGATWRMLPVITTNFLRDVDFNENGYGCAVGYGVVLTREPGADQWNRERDQPGLYLQSVACGPDGIVLAAGHWGTLMRSADFGRTWTLLDDHFAPDLLDIAVDGGSGMVMGVGSDGWTLILHPEDGSWKPSFSGSKDTLKAVAVDQRGRFWTLSGDSGVVFRYSGPTGWERVSLAIENERQLNDILFTGAAQGFIAGDDGTLLHSSDCGETWQVHGLPIRKNVHGIFFIDENHGFVVGDAGLVMETGNGGLTWLGQFTGVTSDFRDAVFCTDGHAVVLSPGGALESWSNGHNSSWHDMISEYPVTAIARGGRYAGLLNGDILDRRTGISRCVSHDPIRAFAADKNGFRIWGAGRFGRITRLKTSDIHFLLAQAHREQHR
jgi:photosystem II stability/assembly factor-like uncharacterized protein